MTVTSCKLEFSSQEYEINVKYEQKAPLTWIITTNDVNDGPLTVEKQSHSVGPHPVPVAYQPYAVGNDFDQYLLCRSVKYARIANSQLHWRATAQYDNTMDPGQKEENPLLRAPIDTWDNEQYQRATEFDIKGKVIANPNGQAYDPPISIDDSRPILTYTRNEPSYPVQFLTYQDAVNSDAFLIFDPGTAKVNITAQKRFEGKYKYYETKYVFHFRREGWKRKGLNRGTLFRTTAGGAVHKLPTGDPPVTLNKDGTIAAAGVGTYTEFEVYKEAPFGPLNIYIV